MANQHDTDRDEPQRTGADEENIRGIADEEDDFDDEDDLDEEDEDDEETA